MSHLFRLKTAARAAILAAPVFLSTSLSTQAAPTVRLSGHVPVQLASAQKIGDVAPATCVPLALSLPLRNTHELGDLVKNLYDASSPLFGKYLTPAQFASRFGPTPADYQAVIAYAQSQGLTVTHTFTARTVLDVAGPASAVQKAFGVHLNNYVGKDKKSFFASDADPAVPMALAGKIDTIVGLSNAAKLKPQYIILTPQQRASALAKRDVMLKASGAQAIRGPQFGFGHGHNGAYSPSDLQVGYDLVPLPFTGGKQILGVFALGGFLQGDVDAYCKYYHLPNIPVKVVPVDGYGGAVNDNDIGGAIEAVLDIDMQTALAPGASEIRVYEAPDFTADGDYNYPQGLVDALAVAADENKVAQMSISYGEDEDGVSVPTIKAEFTTLMQMAAQGQSVFASAGDVGAFGDGSSLKVSVIDPGSQPYITCVGGTELYENSDSTYFGEVTWNELALLGSATGGGVSKHHNIPFYQKGTPGLASTTKRNVPDVAAVADPITGVDIYTTFANVDADGNYTPGYIPVGGTSVSAPLWAGFTARVNQLRASSGLPQLGFANPAIYYVGNGQFEADDYHDIYDGTNGNGPVYGFAGYAAGIGYDNVTGFGSMNGNDLIQDLSTYTNPNVSPPSSITDISYTSTLSSITLHYTAAQNAVGYQILEAKGNAIRGPFNYFIDGATKNTYFRLTGLKSGTTYKLAVGAVNAGGITYSAFIEAQTK